MGLICSGSAQAEDAFDREVLRQARMRGPDVEQAMRQGKAASDKADFASAAKHYANAAAKAPGFAHALRRECGAELALGQRARGETLCRAAVAADPEPHNTAALAMALATGAEPAKLAEAEALLQGARASAPDLDVVYFAQFHLERERKNLAGTRAAFAEIKRTATDKASIAHYAAALAGALLASDQSAAAKDEASLLAKSALHDARDDLSTMIGVAQVALGVGDDALFGSATQRLQRIAPELMLTHYFVGLRAAMRGEWSAARDALKTAKAKGFPADQYDALMARIDDAEPWPSRVWPLALRVAAGWTACLLLLLLLGSLLSMLTMRAARRLPTLSGHQSDLSLALRRTYAAVIAAACAFYYVSLPLVVVAVLGGAAGIIYGFIALGHVPIKLVLVVGLVALVSAWAVVKSVFVRARDNDPGSKLDLAREPGVRALLDEVAAKVGTRAVDSVYLTPGTDVAVFERGGMVKQMRGQSERCLVLGLGVLDGMRLTDLKAILAHEYGHFSNRDTAGGGLALAVRRSLISMAQGLAQGGAATWYNPAWWFFRGFFSVFLRVSQGASRLQEVLADRWAAFCYGSEAFVRGLTHVIERSVRFDAQANVALRSELEARSALTNLYSHLRSAQISESDVSREVQEALERKPSAFDSHPAPRDRIAWVRALAAPEPTCSDADREPEAWTVFADRERLEWQMTQQVNDALGLTPTAAGPETP
jgi:Zn-dependent protease with chaperone function